jgi:hypothetical protein
MRKEKKVSREEEEVVCVTELRGAEESVWLFVKRPEKGMSVDAILADPARTSRWPIRAANHPCRIRDIRVSAESRSISYYFEAYKSERDRLGTSRLRYLSCRHLVNSPRLQSH